MLPDEIDSSAVDEKCRSVNLGSIGSWLHQKEHCLMPSSEKAGHAKIAKKVVLDSSLDLNELRPTAGLQGIGRSNDLDCKE